MTEDTERIRLHGRRSAPLVLVLLLVVLTIAAVQADTGVVWVPIGQEWVDHWSYEPIGTTTEEVWVDTSGYVRLGQWRERHVGHYEGWAVTPGYVVIVPGEYHLAEGYNITHFVYTTGIDTPYIDHPAEYVWDPIRYETETYTEYHQGFYHQHSGSYHWHDGSWHWHSGSYHWHNGENHCHWNGRSCSWHWHSGFNHWHDGSNHWHDGFWHWHDGENHWHPGEWHTHSRTVIRGCNCLVLVRPAWREYGVLISTYNVFIETRPAYTDPPRIVFYPEIYTRVTADRSHELTYAIDEQPMPHAEVTHLGFTVDCTSVVAGYAVFYSSVNTTVPLNAFIPASVVQGGVTHTLFQQEKFITLDCSSTYETSGYWTTETVTEYGWLNHPTLETVYGWATVTPTPTPASTATPTPTRTPTPTPTPIPIQITLSRDYGTLLLYGPDLGQPAQRLWGDASGGSGAPYHVEFTLIDPDGGVRQYSLDTDGSGYFTLDSGTSGDGYFGTQAIGTWRATANVFGTDSNTVTWAVKWFPVNERR